MKVMQSENPELWKQFEDFSSTLGIPSGGAAFKPGGVASHGESSVDQGGAGNKSGGREESLAGVFEETLQKLKQNTEGLEVSAYHNTHRI